MDNVEGTDPGFVDAAGHDFHLSAGSAATGIVVPLASATASYPVTAEYALSGGSERAAANNAGAFE